MGIDRKSNPDGR